MKRIIGPDRSHDLHLSGPIDRWDEAIPLGNGLMGALLWGDGRNLKLSLDRGDMWDVRLAEVFKQPGWNFAAMKKLAAEKNTERMRELFDAPYSDSAYPSKLPAGRLELMFDRKTCADEFGLDIRRALGWVKMGKASLEVFCSAAEPVGMIRVQGSVPRLKIIPPECFTNAADQLGYSFPEPGKSKDVQWVLQKGAEGFAYAIVAATKKTGSVTEIAFTVRTNRDAHDPVAAGRKILEASLAAGFDRMLSRHADWWKEFWARSAISLPDKAIEQHYYLAQYFYGSASRRGAPPIPLQGVWTADEGSLPPWKGDYHNDLNTQLTYWAYLAAGHLEEGLCFLEFLWNLRPQFRKFARDFFDAPGLNPPGVMTLDGKPLGGWPQYSYSLTAGAWLSQAFYLHWRYTMDREYLETMGYPFCREAGEFLEAILTPDKKGKLKLPLSSSPEIHDNRQEAWLKPNSNFDLSLMRWLFGALVEMAKELKEKQDARRWQGVLDRLDDLHVGDGRLKISADEFLTESHRHHSHLMAIHPLGILSRDKPEEAKIIEASLLANDSLGMQWWVGYSFGWMACLAARAGQGGKALNMLELYLKGFVSRNGFHLNGDFKNLGLSAFKYRPFTLEGNFAAAQAVHEMLLQSCGGVVRVFPAVPVTWSRIAFSNLRAEGAFRVSASRQAGRTVRIRVVAEKDCTLRLRDPFGGGTIKWNQRGIKKAGCNYICVLKAGDILEGIGFPPIERQ